MKARTAKQIRRVVHYIAKLHEELGKLDDALWSDEPVWLEYAHDSERLSVKEELRYIGTMLEGWRGVMRKLEIME